MDSFVLLIVILMIGAVVASFVMRGKDKAGGTASATKQPYTPPTQLTEDMRMTQTSRVVDAVQILDELGMTSASYRHYCELVGTSMTAGGVTAPYSKRQVAYYDLRCYRVENVQGTTKETLVAQEKSPDPFWFSDGTSADHVYVDLESFGLNCILVNATNRMEGPSSEFAKAMAGAAHGATGSYGVHAAFDRGIGSLGRATPRNANLRAPGPGGYGTPGGYRGGGFGGPGRSPQQMPTRSPYGQPSMSSRSGSMGGMPSDLDIFFGGGLSRGTMSGYGGPRYRQGSSSDDAMEALLGIGLGALVAGMAATSSTSRPSTPVSPTASFQGYRIIEDVVPLGSPVYALGELYRNGDRLYIGRSLSETYASSYFATKSEAEVLNTLK